MQVLASVVPVYLAIISQQQQQLQLQQQQPQQQQQCTFLSSQKS